MKSDDLMDAFGGLPDDFIARELDYEPPRRRTAFLVSKPFLAGASTAAYLLLIVGLGLGVWSRQQKIEPLPLQETQTTTVSETRTETTAQVTTESQTTGKQTAESTKKPEITTIPTLNSGQLQHPTSAAALLTTVALTGTMNATTMTRQTNAATISTQQNTLSAVPNRTAPPQTSMTARIQGQIAPITEQITRATLTTSNTTTVIVTTTYPQTDPSEPWSSNPSYTSPTDPDTKTDVFTGFHVTLGGPFGLNLRITPEPEDDDPDDFSLEYGIDGTDFEYIKVDKDFRYFCILSADGSREILFGQEIRKPFYFDYVPDKDEQIFAWGDCPGFVREDPNGWCSCIWDDGNYIMSAVCYREDLPLLKKVHPIAN